MNLTIHFDGGCAPVNPGGVATFGWWIEGLPAPHADLAGCGVIGAGGGMTNNFAEWVACGKAIGALVVLKVKPDAIAIYGDSALVINQLTGDWECRDSRLADCRDRCIEYLERLGCKWTAQWIPREQNVAADRLSRAAYVGRVGKPIPERVKGGAR